VRRCVQLAVELLTCVLRKEMDALQIAGNVLSGATSSAAPTQSEPITPRRRGKDKEVRTFVLCYDCPHLNWTR
jgi:hypothetical protein